MKEKGIVPPGIPKPRVCVVYLGAEAKTVAMVLTQELRASGIGTSVLWEDRSLKAQMKQADRSGAIYTLIIGEDEMSELDPETVYFIVHILNRAGLKRFRNEVLTRALPLRT